MKTIEEQLKEIIVLRYGSVLAFSKIAGIPNPTVASILNRGIKNASVINVIKICQILGISTDDLADGKIIPVTDNLKNKNLADVNTILGNAVGCLLNADKVVFDGKELQADAVKDLVNLLTLDVEFLRKKMEK